MSVADPVWAETFDCEKDTKEASAALVRMIANFFLNITKSLIYIVNFLGTSSMQV
jgi:hypothetical protein